MTRRALVPALALCGLLAVSACSDGDDDEPAAPITTLAEPGDHPLCKALDHHDAVVADIDEQYPDLSALSRQDAQRALRLRRDAEVALAEVADDVLAEDIRHDVVLRAALDAQLLLAWDGTGLAVEQRARAAGYSSAYAYVARKGIRIDDDVVGFDEAQRLRRAVFERVAIPCRAPELAVPLAETAGAQPPAGRIVFARPDGDGGVPVEIWTVTVPGGEPERIELPDGMVASSPTLAPDGRQLAFTGRVVEDDAENGESGVWVVDDITEPASAKRLGPAGQRASCPAWSPRGDRVLALVGEGQEKRLLLLSPSDATETRIRIDFVERGGPVDLGCASFVDADTLAVDLTVEGEASVWLVSIDGGEAAPLLVVPECNVAGGAASPDRARVVAAATCADPRDTGLYVAPVDEAEGGPQLAVRGRVSAGGFSPDGEWVVVGYVPFGSTAPWPSLWAIELATGDAVRVADAPATFPSWGPSRAG